MKIASALLAALLLPALLSADYEIRLKGGARYWTRKKPVERNGAVLFTATDGTFLSVRRADVASIRAGEAPKVEKTPEPTGETSPVDAARHQRELARRLHPNSPEMPQNNDAYRPGVGVPFAPGTNDYVVGKTWAPPPGSTVYSGPAPSGVVSGDAPKGVPSGDAPKGAPGRDAPKGAPSTDAPIGAPPADAVPPPPPPPH